MEIQDNFIKIQGAPKLFESQADAVQWVMLNNLGKNVMIMADNGIRKRQMETYTLSNGIHISIDRRFVGQEEEYAQVLIDGKFVTLIPSAVSSFVTIRKSGTSLVIAISEMAKFLDLNAGDQVEVCISLIRPPEI